MKGDKKLIETLNSLLSHELTAVSQYMVQGEMCANWGYKELAEAIEKRAIDEMKHAEKHIARILFLEGMPVVGLREVPYRDRERAPLGADDRHVAEERRDRRKRAP